MMESLAQLATRFFAPSFPRKDCAHNTRVAAQSARGICSRLCAAPGRRDEKGASYAMMVVLLPVLLGFMALVIEEGMIFEVRRQLQTAVDAGALAGAQRLPSAPAAADADAHDYVNRNRESIAVTTVTIGTTYYSNDTITVTGVRTVPLVLMPILGYARNQNVAASATAIVGTLGVGDCIVPLGVLDQNGKDENGSWTGNGFGYQFLDYVTLKVGAQDNVQGKFQPLNLYGPGANVYRDAIRGVCPENKSVNVGDVERVQTGNMVGPTIQGFEDRIGSDPAGMDHFNQVVTQLEDGTVEILDPDCPRLVVVPIIDSWDFPGSSGNVTILAFAHFYVEQVMKENDKSTKPPTQIGVVKGIFVDTVTPGIFTGYNPTGARVVRLMR